MSSPDERWWSVRAGEYVLGTLRGDDLMSFERILDHDTSVQAEVAQWEQRLAALNETTVAHTPNDDAWPHILDRVRRLDDGATSEESAHPGSVQPITSSRKLLLWKSLTGLATAASVVLGVMLLQRPADLDALSLEIDGLAVVLSDDSGEPYFLVETDYGNLRVRVTALTPPSLDETRNFQLWQALPDRSSVRPVALLPEEPGTSSIFKVDSLIDGSDLFGVSIEPVGALTEGGPTGPVVAHGDFLLKRGAN